jgi:glucose-6-phosphate 1-dehydrogenase
LTTPLTIGARPSTHWSLSDVPLETTDPCTMIIFGGSGDLTRRKLIPALYQLACEKLLARNFAIVAVARDAANIDSFRTMLRESLGTSDEVHNIDDKVWSELSERISYVTGNFSEPDCYQRLAEALSAVEQKHGTRNRLFYLAVPPSVFEPIIRNLTSSGLAPRTVDPKERPWVRLVVEKPYGRSLETARALNRFVLERFGEHQVYRIDHYLCKETVQNILVLRFANSIFEPLWNRNSISHVQITAAETVGVEKRGGYYEEAGVVRDMFQNHLLQLLTLTAMEPPVAIHADAVRDEKVKALKSVRWLTPETIPEATVRAQYAEGVSKGAKVAGYRTEPNVAPASNTPTYAAVRLMIDNWRWQGVPFYLRSGKRMPKRVSEIAVAFKKPPYLMFGHKTGAEIEPSTLIMRVQPNDGISLRFEVKVPGAARALSPDIEVAPVEMDFSYAEAFGEHATPAYGTLLLDAMIGNATLFARSDEVEAAWKVVDPLLDFWDKNPPKKMPTYAAGTWGPKEADDLVGEAGFRWREP